MRLILAAAPLILLAACDTYGIDPAPVPTPAPGGVDTLGALRLGPRATYLRTHRDSAAALPLRVALDSLGAAPGDALTFFVSGYATLDPAAPQPTRSRDVVGVFAASSNLEAPAAPRRVRDALDAGADFVTDSTALGRYATDVPEDFFATRATVTVPSGATHLFLALHDVFYSDNVSVGDGVLVTVLRQRTR